MKDIGHIGRAVSYTTTLGVLVISSVSLSEDSQAKVNREVVKFCSKCMRLKIYMDRQEQQALVHNRGEG